MSNLQNAKLVLNTADSDSYNNMNTNFTWNNINLRTVLGDMYDKYDMFNLVLNSISVDYIIINSGINNDEPGSDVFEKNLIINISGLPFINQTYDVGNLSNTSSVVLTSFLFLDTVPSIQYYYGTHNIIFRKNQELVNFNIFYSKINNTEIAQQTTNPYPNALFIFDIYGVDETKHDITKHRMLIK